ncbi:hypothetical protein ABL78_3719 [Leptomonas seymouri]|uniref:Uncharacterized protein n=1 Tax=Leptomonas seymouri TaxID=5684 RepID=A0A0N1HZ69_LEPSE|nr:hypothetical protein ABL78_3719 [Leptomonas seymouri]|eukprot:KPI87203.1 hypothetical protein ABL78_3719 [Leptomonas seymouri]
MYVSMLQRVLVRCALSGAAAMLPHTRSSACPYSTTKQCTPITTPPSPPSPPPQQPLASVPPTPAETQLTEFRRFCETVMCSPEVTSLPPTPLGHGGCERIFVNALLHKSPWQASCVELRERVVRKGPRVMSYDNIDFASLSRRPCTTTERSKQRSYSNVEDTHPKEAAPPGPGVDVVHYYETSTAAGLASYQRVAMQVQKGLLPGTCTNFSAEGGFAVWAVPHNQYAQAMRGIGMLTT